MAQVTGLTAISTDNRNESRFGARAVKEKEQQQQQRQEAVLLFSDVVDGGLQFYFICIGVPIEQIKPPIASPWITTDVEHTTNKS